MKLNKLIKVLALAGVVGSGTAQAALVDRGGGMIYDTDLNITWLADANYARTSGYDADGRMNWNAANAWAAGLTYGGFSDWRLPTSDGCYGYNCTGSEMGHLYYTELGGTYNSSILFSGDPDLSLFRNITSFIYWSGTVYAPDPVSNAMAFILIGHQGYGLQSNEFYAWAVRDGDVASAVPEPGSALLVGLGLAGLAATRRRRALGAA